MKLENDPNCQWFKHRHHGNLWQIEFARNTKDIIATAACGYLIASIAANAPIIRNIVPVITAIQPIILLVIRNKIGLLISSLPSHVLISRMTS